MREEEKKIMETNDTNLQFMWLASDTVFGKKVQYKLPLMNQNQKYIFYL